MRGQDFQLSWLVINIYSAIMNSDFQKYPILGKCIYMSWSLISGSYRLLTYPHDNAYNNKPNS